MCLGTLSNGRRLIRKPAASLASCKACQLCVCRLRAKAGFVFLNGREKQDYFVTRENDTEFKRQCPRRFTGTTPPTCSLLLLTKSVWTQTSRGPRKPEVFDVQLLAEKAPSPLASRHIALCQVWLALPRPLSCLFVVCTLFPSHLACFPLLESSFFDVSFVPLKMPTVPGTGDWRKLVSCSYHSVGRGWGWLCQSRTGRLHRMRRHGAPLCRGWRKGEVG